MRFFEILLLLSIGFFLINQITKKFNTKTRALLLILTGLICIIQIIVEGYRWQLIPAYVLLIIFSTSFFNTKKASKVGRFTLMALSFLLFAISSFLCYALPILQFKKAQETYSVGVEEVHLVDRNRDELMTEDPNDKREVSIRVYYPTPIEHSSKYPYIPSFNKIRHTYKKKLGWPDFMTDYLKLFTIEAEEKAPYFKKEVFPLVFYSHGLTNNYNEASGRLMQIASNGYVVVALNHNYGSDFGMLKNGEVVGYKALSVLGDPIKKVDSVKTFIAKQWYNDAEFVRQELQNRKISNSIDFKNVGLIGFSAGGTMSTLGGYKFKNIKAVINLDGTPRGLNYKEKSNAPYLGLFSEPLHFSDEQIKAWGIDREILDAPKKMIKERSLHVLKVSPKPSYIITIPNTKHSNFIEYPLVSPLSNFLEIGGSINSKDCYEFQNRLIQSFLDNTLKNKSKSDINKILDMGKNQFNIEVLY